MQEEITNQGAELETPEETIIDDVSTDKDSQEKVDKDLPDSKKDPLDEIQDPELLRKEAKKFRGIAGRKSEEKPPEAQKIEQKADYVTKADLEKQAERTAIKAMTIVSDSDDDMSKAMKEAIADNWNDISSFYVNRNGREEPEQIMEDIQDAYILWSRKKGTSDGIADLISTPVVKTSGGQQPKSQDKTASDPRFRLPKKPTEWYKK